jgi:hypothetical protein
MFGAFVAGCVVVVAGSLILAVLSLFVFALFLVAFLGWVPFLGLGIALFVGGRSDPRLRWVGAGILSMTVTLYAPVVAFLYADDQLSETVLYALMGGGTLVALGSAGLVAARSGRR